MERKLRALLIVLSTLVAYFGSSDVVRILATCVVRPPFLRLVLFANP
jgi:hypothetical protein